MTRKPATTQKSRRRPQTAQNKGGSGPGARWRAMPAVWMAAAVTVVCVVAAAGIAWQGEDDALQPLAGATEIAADRVQASSVEPLALAGAHAADPADAIAQNEAAAPAQNEAAALSASDGMLLAQATQPANQAPAGASSATPAASDGNPIDGPRAYRYLNQICALGPRISGSLGMTQQQDLIEAHLTALGAQVSRQRFLARNPLGGERVPMTNLIAEWHPERPVRVLLCTHYDTRPLPDRDPNPVLRRNGVFLGANDGGSGTALLMELAHHMADLDVEFGVDFLFIDGEELVYEENRDPYFLGSEWFARQYVQNPPPHRYRWGVLLDMVGDADLQLLYERNSITWRDTRPLVREIWSTAQRLGVKEFVPQVGFQVNDDHVRIRNIAKIPTCDIIDFEYDPWHTTSDVPRQCSAESLAKVGWVVYEWLQTTNVTAAGR